MTTNLVTVAYEANEKSVNTNDMGMREMQSRAFAERNRQYLLIKSPPASGKSRALMFIGIDKLAHQGIKKVIIAVPEKSIGGSFQDTDLKTHGFWADWEVKPENNLCVESNATSKQFKAFMNSKDMTLVCTHSTLRNVFKVMRPEDFNDCLLAIDEFHHVSANEENILGNVLQSIMDNSNAHIVSMTGSYFRGDSEAILLPMYEDKFHKVTYNYYEQLNGYKYLKSLAIGYHFYQGSYISELDHVLDTDKKTILHIPNVNSMESTGNKYNEVGAIIDHIGEVIMAPDGEEKAAAAGVIFVKRHGDGKVIKVADLVNDDSKEREKIQTYLREIEHVDEMDLIIALGMAKEGFDWSYCEHSLTVGYRGSLTEVIQIIGRCTRDSSNKSHAQFTNLIINPEVGDGLIKESVNNMLKAITCSLLMEQIMQPSLDFRSSASKDNAFDEKYAEDNKELEGMAKPTPKNEVVIKGFAEPSTKAVKKIIAEDTTEIKAKILQDDRVKAAMAGGVDNEVANKVFVAEVIKEMYEDLDLEDHEIEEVRQHIVASSVIKQSNIETVDDGKGGQSRFIKDATGMINLDELNIDLIDNMSMFGKSFDVMSKNVTPSVLKAIKNELDSRKISITEEEVLILFQEGRIDAFWNQHQRPPAIDSADPMERRMAEAILFIEKVQAELGDE